MYIIYILLNFLLIIISVGITIASMDQHFIQMNDIEGIIIFSLVSLLFGIIFLILLIRNYGFLFMLVLTNALIQIITYSLSFALSNQSQEGVMLYWFLYSFPVIILILIMTLIILIVERKKINKFLYKLFNMDEGSVRN